MKKGQDYGSTESLDKAQVGFQGASQFDSAGRGPSPRGRGKGLVVLLAVSPSSSSIYVI